MREAAERTKQLLRTGLSVERVIEGLIHEGYFTDTADIRNHLTPVVRELQMKMPKEEAKGFKLKCCSCGNAVDINEENAGTYIHLFGYGKSKKGVSIEDVKDKILIYDIEDGQNQGILCKCGNAVTE